MVSGLEKGKPAENGKSKTLVSKGSTSHNVSATYTREEIKLLVDKYFMHKLKR